MDYIITIVIIFYINDLTKTEGLGVEEVGSVRGGEGGRRAAGGRL